MWRYTPAVARLWEEAGGLSQDPSLKEWLDEQEEYELYDVSCELSEQELLSMCSDYCGGYDTCVCAGFTLRTESGCALQHLHEHQCALAPGLRGRVAPVF